MFSVSVAPEPLRKRPPYSSPKTSGCHSHHSHHSPPSPFQPQQPRPSIDWIKFNILVGIYQNWLRMAPLLTRLLACSPLNTPTPENSPRLLPLKKNTQKVVSLNSTLARQFSQTFKELKELRQKVSLKKVVEMGRDSGQVLAKMAHLSKQILDSLPVETKAWTKARIQSHNRVIDQFLNSNGEDASLAVSLNYEAIVNSLNERIRFIEEVQQSIHSPQAQDRKELARKLSILKRPFHSNHRRDNIRDNLRDMVHHLELKKKKVNSRPSVPIDPHRFEIEENPGRSTVFAQEKRPSTTSKQRNSHTSTPFSESQKHSNFHKLSSMKRRESSNCLFSSLLKMEVKSVSNTEDNKSSSTESIPFAPEKRADVRQRKAKLFTKESCPFPAALKKPKPNLSKTVTLCPDSDKRTSYSRTSAISINSSDLKEIPRKDSIQMGEIQELDETELEQRFSRYKSNQKIGTMKHIAAIQAGRKGQRATREKQFRRGPVKESFAETLPPGVKLTKKKREYHHHQNRTGNFVKKGTARKELELEPTLDDPLAPQGTDYLGKKSQIIEFLRHVRDRGILEGDKYAHLRSQLDFLLQKCSLCEVEKSRKNAELADEKSKKKGYFSLSSGEGRVQFLAELRDYIQDDEAIKAKIISAFELGQGGRGLRGSDLIPNEQYFLTTVENGHNRDSLRRVQQFKEEGQRCELSAELVRQMMALSQKSP